jgi:autotransporter passenger strand-loop-strand repeat protein
MSVTVSSGQTVSLTSTTSGTVVSAGGTFDVLAGGIANAGLIEGLMQVSAGGSASATTIGVTGIGGEVIVSSGGVVSATTIAYGTQVIAAGGSAAGTVVSNGTEIVSGFASGTILSGYGNVQSVTSGGLAVSTTLSEGGTQIVYAGGSATGTVVSGGIENVSGGIVAGLDLAPQSQPFGPTAELLLDGGSAGLALGDTASGDVIDFEGTSATLGISGTAMPVVAISGFDNNFAAAGAAAADTIDLQSIAFGAGGSAVLGSGNVLSVTEGGNTYTLTFDPGQNFAGESFQLATDGGSGTDITLAYSGYVVTSGQSASLTSALSGATVFLGGTLDVLAGGAAISATDEGLVQVSSGGLASAVTIDGGLLTVSSGGTASGTIINDTGSQTVSAGGSAVGTIVSSGSEIVFGTASGTTVSGDFDVQIVSSGGLAVSTTLISGGQQTVSSGGSAVGTVVSGGGTVSIDGGSASALDLVASGPSGLNAYLEIFGGSAGLAASDSATGDAIDFAGASAMLGISGTVMPTAIISGFDSGFFSAGPTLADTIDLQSVAFSAGGRAVLGSGNVLSVTEGGSTYTLTLDPGQNFVGEQFQLTADGSGGTDLTLAYSGFVVTSGETTSLTSALSGATVFSGGTLDVLAGGALSAAVVLGSMEVNSGGAASGTTLSGTYPYGTQSLTVSSGGVVSGTVIDDGLQVIAAGGSAVGTIVNDGEEVVAGTATGTVVSGFSALQTVVSGGLAVSTTVISGAEQVVSAGGSATGTVLSGGIEAISGGSAGGVDLVTSSGPYHASLDLYGGSAGLAAGDVASGDVIDFLGSSATLGISGATMPAATISGFDAAGPTMADTIDLQSVAFSAGGSAVLGGGNVLSVTEGGNTYTLSLDPQQSFLGATFQLAADGNGGTDITLAYSGLVVTSGETTSLTSAVSGAVVFSGGTLDVLAGGTATSAIDEGLVQVSSGGVASGVTVIGNFLTADFLNIGALAVSSGGIASGSVISNGGVQIVAAGGSAVGTAIVSGSEVVSGTASGTVVSAYGASQEVASGGLALATLVSSGTQVVDAGGSAVGTVVSGGGTVSIDGGSASGLDLLGSNSFSQVAVLYLSGGSAGLAPNDSATAARIYFAGASATLGISGTVMPAAIISGFDSGFSIVGPALADAIDLQSVAFSAGGSAVLGSGNVLSVTEGGNTYTLDFARTQLFAGESFQLAADGSGGTDITLAYSGPVVTSGQILSLTSALSGATVFPGGTLDVLAGGTALSATDEGLVQVSAGGSASGTMVEAGGSAVVWSGGIADRTTIDGGAQMIETGGSAAGTVIDQGLEQVAGGRANGTVVSGELSVQTVLAGGVAIATSLTDLGQQTVASGATVVGTVVNGGTETISGGTASGVDLMPSGSPGSFAVLQISGGSAGLAAGDTADGDMILFAGSSATLGISATVMPSATISGFDSGYVSAGPTLADTIDLQSVVFSSGGGAVLGSGNVLSVTEGGNTYTLQFDPNQLFAGESFQLAADGSGGTDITLAYSGFVVTSGQVVSLTSSLSGATVFPGGTLDVLAGGTATSATDEGLVQVGSGGVAGDMAVVGGGLVVGSGGVARATVITDGAQVTVASGGIASGTVISGTFFGEVGTTQTIDAGASAVGTVIDAGVEIVSGTASGTVISGDLSSQTVQSSGLAVSATVVSGGTQVVSAGASAVGTVVSGGTESVSGGTATAVMLSATSGGQETALFLYGGSAGLAADESASGSVIDFQGTSATLGISGTAMPIAAISGFDIGFDAAGPALADTIDLQSVAFSASGSAVLGSGNVLSVTEGGNTYTLDFAATQLFAGESFQLSTDDSGGTDLTLAYSGTVITSGQTVSVTSALSAATVFPGGTVDVLAGGTAAAVTDEGLVQVGTGGLASGVIVAGGSLGVASGGIASGSIIDDGGQQIVSAGGSAVGTLINDGMETVFGTASGTVAAGFIGSQYVSSGGVAVSTMLSDGGAQVVESGGSAVGTVVSHGNEIVFGGIATGIDMVSATSGGAAASLSLYAGSAVLAAGDTANGDVIDFTGTSATLGISGTTMPVATISGFDSGFRAAGPTLADTIDLQSVAFGAGGSAVLGSGNVLSVTEGGSTYMLQLDPGQLFAGESFQLSADGSGGTDITLAYSGTVITAGQTVSLTSALSGATVFPGGTLEVLAGGTAISAAVEGLVQVSAGGTAIGADIGAGGDLSVFAGGTANGVDLIDESAGGSLSFFSFALLNLNDGASAGLAAGDVAAGDVIDFSGTSATLGISGTTMPTATISGFDAAGPATGDTIDLHGIAFSAGGAVSLGSGNVLSVTEGGATYTLNLDPAQSFAGETFRLTTDGAGGTDITAPPCYAAGTRLATLAGDVPVEALRAGDAVLARMDGDWAPHRVRWVGRMRVDLTRHPRPDRAAPVRIRADAFAPGVPARDLLLSPDHAVFLDGVLIQAQALVNGATIVRDDPAAITYVHVELDRHGLLLADGLAAESYLDTGNRGQFAGEAGARALHPDLSAAAAWDTRACAPLLLGGARVAGAHAALRARAEALGFARSDDPALAVLAGAAPLARDAAGRFLVPAGTPAVRLHSRVFVPRWFGGTDDRRLGVAVTALRLDGRALPARAFGAGWHAREPQWRWTDGNALLHLPPHSGPAPRRLTIRCAAIGRYWSEQRPVPTAPAASARR